MKTRYATTAAALVLSSLFAGQAMAAFAKPEYANADEIRASIASSTKQRADVRAEAVESVRNAVVPTGDLVNPDQLRADMKPTGKTREQTKAELFQARRQAAESKEFVFPTI